MQERRLVLQPPLDSAIDPSADQWNNGIMDVVALLALIQWKFC